MLEVRRIGPDAAETFAALCVQTFRRAYADLHDAADLDAYCAAHYSVEAARATLENPAHICTLAELDGRAIGYSVVRDAPCPLPLAGASAELKQLYLLPEAFGAGIGRALLDDALKSARALGAAHIWLAVADINPRGPPFYRKAGFAYAGAGPTFHVGKDVVTSKIMARAI